MTRQLAIAFLYIALGSLLHAEGFIDNQKIIGIEIGSTEVQGDQPDDESRDVSFGLRVGAENDEWRTMFTLNLFDSDEHNLEKIVLTVDYLFFNADEYALQPYFGLNAGYFNFESNKVDASGIMYGAQFGLAYDVAENVGLDLGYRYSISGSDGFDHSGDIIFAIDYQF